MTIEVKPPLDEALLLHYGVKGMKWGTHKEQTPAQQIQKINKKIARIDANQYIEGVSLRGHYAKKQYKKESKRNPKFAYNKLSPEAKAKFDSTVARKARTGVALRGAAEVAVILGGVNLLAKGMGASPRAKNGALVSAAILSAQAVVIPRGSQIRAINRSLKSDKLRSQRDRLGYNPDTHWR